MKNYFARLAARAAPIRTTPPRQDPAGTGAADPFEVVATVAPSPAAPLSAPLFSPNATKPSPKAPPEADVAEAIAPVPAPPIPAVARPASAVPAAPIRAPAHRGPGKVTVTGRGLANRPAAGQPSPPLSSPASAAQLKPQPSSAPEFPAAGPLPQEEATSPKDPQPEKLERAKLMRRADAFMSQLISTSPPARLEPVEDPASRHAGKATQPYPHSPATEPAQGRPLRPESPAANPAHREPERPSLTIGRLTVEVMPPPAPAAAKRERVVVRTPARGAAANLPSSRRFGLGQF